MPFGLDRLKVIEWLHSLLILKDEAICKKMDELGFPAILINLMREYDMNSFLHFKIFNVFNEALSIENPIFPEIVYQSSK